MYLVFFFLFLRYNFLLPSLIFKLLFTFTEEQKGCTELWCRVHKRRTSVDSNQLWCRACHQPRWIQGLLVCEPWLQPVSLSSGEACSHLVLCRPTIASFSPSTAAAAAAAFSPLPPFLPSSTPLRSAKCQPSPCQTL